MMTTDTTSKQKKLEVLFSQMKVADELAQKGDKQAEADARAIYAEIQRVEQSEEPAATADTTEKAPMSGTAYIAPGAGAMAGTLTGLAAGPTISKKADPFDKLFAKKPAMTAGVSGPESSGDAWNRKVVGALGPGAESSTEAALNYNIEKGLTPEERAKYGVTRGGIIVENAPSNAGDLPHRYSAPPVQPPASNLPPWLEAKQRAQKMLSSPSMITKPAGRVGSGIKLGAAGELAGKAYQEGSQGNYGAALSDLIQAGIAGAGVSKYKPARVLGNIVAGKEVLGGLSPYFTEPEKKAAGGAVQGYATGKIVDVVENLGKKFKYDPAAVTHNYPKVIPPVQAIDKKTGNQYLQKQLSSEAKAVQNARKYAQGEIDKGQYTPFFNLEERFHVDPKNYPLPQRTIDLTLPKKAETVAAHQAKAGSPEARARLNEAYEAAKGHSGAHDFYAMGQLEDAFVKELGPEKGRAAFKARFADPLAATTGGADPNANLMTAAYTNYVRTLGQDLPEQTYDLPFPIGGRFIAGNIDQARKYHQVGELSPINNPKRYNFASNFQGHLDRPTVDEQMMRLFDPKGKMAPDWYGINEDVINQLAKEKGVTPVNFQEVAWAGGKGYEGKPMMQEINEMIHRTSRITGQSPDEVLKGFIHGNKPMYGVGTGLIGVNAMPEEKADGGVIRGYANLGKVKPAFENTAEALKRGLRGGSYEEDLSAAQKFADKAKSRLILPPAENAARTQIIGTLPTYQKSYDILKNLGAKGRGIDFGAGLGEGAKVLGKDFDTYEPFAQNWAPTFSNAADVPSDAYGKLTNLNVLNVVPREVRDTIVEDIGRVMEPGGYGIITTRGKDVMNAKGTAGPEPLSIITSRDTYQKGFTKDELEEYMKYILGDKFNVNRLNLGPAGVIIEKKAEGGSSTPAWQRKEGKNPEGGLNAIGRASYNRETGGNLKAPQPQGGARKDSFCARMEGMKKKLTSSETANDPDSRINKSLRKWKC